MECLHKKVVSEATDLTVDLLENLSVIGNFKADSMMNEEKVNAPQDCKWELKNQVVNLQRGKSDQLEENMVSGIHYQALINKSLSTKSLQTKTEQYEHEVHLSELQEEYVMLAELICGLEAVLRYMTEERESNRLVLQNAASQAGNARMR